MCRGESETMVTEGRGDGKEKDTLKNQEEYTIKSKDMLKDQGTTKGQHQRIIPKDNVNGHK